MPATKENTKSKSDESIITSIGVKAEALEVKERGRLNKANRRDNIFWGLFGAFYLVMAVISVVRGDWGQLLFTLAVGMWSPMIWLLNKQLNHQRYIINMMSGLRDIENDALMARVEKDMKTQPKVKR